MEGGFVNGCFSVGSMSRILPFSFPFSVSFGLQGRGCSLHSALRARMGLATCVGAVRVCPLDSGDGGKCVDVCFCRCRRRVVLGRSALGRLTDLVGVRSMVLRLPKVSTLVSRLVAFCKRRIVGGEVVVGASCQHLRGVGFLSAMKL